MIEPLSEEAVRRIIREEFTTAFREAMGVTVPEYVNGVNACVLLDCSPPTLSKYVRMQTVKRYFFGGFPKYKISELMKLKDESAGTARSKKRKDHFISNS